MTTSLIAFGDTQIRQFDGLYSLNDLHRMSGGELKHRPTEFLRLTQTKELVTELSRSGNHHFIKTIRGRNASTYACRELVIAYAAWIKQHGLYNKNNISYNTGQVLVTPRTSGNAAPDSHAVFLRPNTHKFRGVAHVVTHVRIAGSMLRTPPTRLRKADSKLNQEYSHG